MLLVIAIAIGISDGFLIPVNPEDNELDYIDLSKIELGHILCMKIFQKNSILIHIVDQNYGISSKKSALKKRCF